MKKQNPKIGLVVSLLLALSLCLPCGQRAVAAEEVIEIGGTGGALGGLQEAAKAFQKRHPDIRFHFAPSLGSSGGIKALLSGALSLAVSSRPLKDVERKLGASAVEYSRTPFIFVTSHPGKTGDLTLEKLAMIYAGEMKSWSDGAPLRLILRPEGDTDTAYLKAMSPAMDKAVKAASNREGMVVAVTDQDTANAIERVRGGFGPSTLAQIISEQRPLRPFRMNGITPSVASLANGTYPYYKTFYIVTGPRASRGARLFVDYLTSTEGRSVLRRTGHLPSGNAQ